MDEITMEITRILSLDPSALTQTEKDFLTARRGYLTQEQMGKYDFLKKFLSEIPVPGKVIEEKKPGKPVQITGIKIGKVEPKKKKEDHTKDPDWKS